MKDLVILSHLGIGDMIGIHPIVRYNCEKYSNVYIFCKNMNLKNARGMYEDLTNLKIIAIDYNFDTSKEVDIVWRIIKDMNLQESIFLKSGIYKNSSNYTNLPDNFYMDFGMDLSIYDNYFKLPEDKLVQYEELYDKNLFFINGKSSTKNIDSEIMSRLGDTNNYFLVNPNHNLYDKSHTNYELANTFIGLPMLDYVNIIRRSKEIHVIDSAFSLLSKFVSLENSKKYIYNRSGYSLSTNFFKGWEIR